MRLKDNLTVHSIVLYFDDKLKIIVIIRSGVPELISESLLEANFCLNVLSDFSRRRKCCENRTMVRNR